MASIMRYAEDAPTLGREARAGRFATDADGLAAFRVQVDLNRAQSLSSLIESEIIPRLMIAHAADRPASAQPVAEPVIDPAEVEAFAPLVMQVEADALLGHVATMLARGVSVESVMVDLLAPTARLLGEYWEQDRCDFVDVTMGLWRLQEVVHELASRESADRPLSVGGHRALFASMPGDQHSFGTVVIDEMFRREGWLTDRLSEVETPDLLRRASDDWFDMIGLTIGCASHIGGVGGIIAALRNVSRNPRVSIMVGGPAFSADPDLAEQVGADGTARDAKLALRLAATLVRSRQREAASLS